MSIGLIVFGIFILFAFYFLGRWHEHYYHAVRLNFKHGYGNYPDEKRIYPNPSCSKDGDCHYLHPEDPECLKEVHEEAELQRIAAIFHYDRCWDTAAYPSLSDAVYEVSSGKDCPICNKKMDGDK